MKKLTKIIIASILTGIVLFFAGLWFLLVAEGKKDEKESIENQIIRMNELQLEYSAQTAIKIDEQAFCSFQLSEASNIKYNELRTLATHNSYKEHQGVIAAFVSTIFFPILGYDNMNYEHPNTTEQLNLGIRSFEWDISRYKGEFDGFIVQHENLIDPNSWIPNLALALEEVVLWSDYNKGHMPITIMFEFKNHSFKDGETKTMTIDDIPLFEELIESILKEKLFVPNQMLGKYTSMEEMRQNDGFPFLNELQDKVIVLFHRGDITDEYEKRDLKDQKAFVMKLSPKSCFVIENEAIQDKEKIQDLVKEGYIVRTFISKWLLYTQEQHDAAMNSGAQILSSDYIDKKITPEYVSVLNDNNNTMILMR